MDVGSQGEDQATPAGQPLVEGALEGGERRARPMSTSFAATSGVLRARGARQHFSHATKRTRTLNTGEFLITATWGARAVHLPVHGLHNFRIDRIGTTIVYSFPFDVLALAYPFWCTPPAPPFPRCQFESHTHTSCCHRFALEESTCKGSSGSSGARAEAGWGSEARTSSTVTARAASEFAGLSTAWCDSGAGTKGGGARGAP